MINFMARMPRSVVAGSEHTWSSTWRIAEQAEQLVVATDAPEQIEGARADDGSPTRPAVSALRLVRGVHPSRRRPAYESVAVATFLVYVDRRT